MDCRKYKKFPPVNLVGHGNGPIDALCEALRKKRGL